MKRLFQTDLNDRLFHVIILLTRIAVGTFMLTHGFPKLERLLAGGDIRFGNPIGLGPAVSLGLAVFAEFLCSVLIIIGLGTRLATVPLIVTMAVAAFISHGADPFARKELALMYLVVYVILLVTGGGKFSLDRLVFRKK